MLKKSLLLAVTLLASSAMSFAQTRYVVWSGDELTAEEIQIPGEFNGWYNCNVTTVDDAASIESKAWKWVPANVTDPNASSGYLTVQATAETVTPLASMDLVFNAKVEGTGTWNVRLTAANPESDCLVSVPADGEYHQVRMNVQKEFPGVAAKWATWPTPADMFTFALVGANLSADAAIFVNDVHYEAAIAMPEITAEASNITATSADVTYAVTFPEGYTNTKVTVNDEDAAAAATLNLTGLDPKTSYTYTIVAEGEFNGQVFKSENVVTFTTLREAGDASVWYGNIEGVAKQGTNSYNVSIDYTVTYNSDKTLTVEAEFNGFDGIPGLVNHQLSFVRGLVEEWTFMVEEGDIWTYTTKGTVEEGTEVEFFFWLPYTGDVFGGDYHQVYKAGSENEPPTLAPRVKANAQNVTFNSAEIVYTLTPETVENGTVKVYYKAAEGEAVEATENPIVLSGLAEMTAYAYEVYAVAEIDLNGDGVITSEEILESAHAKVEFKTPSENARDIVYGDWANVEFKTNPVIYASLPWQVTYKADGTALYEIDLSEIDGKVAGMVPQIYWNGFKQLTKNAETGMYEYNFGAQEMDATTAISHYIAYQGGVYDSRCAYTNWGMEQARPELGEAVTLALSAAKLAVKAGEEVALSVVSKDEAGHYLPVDAVEYTMFPETGSIENGVFSSNLKGKYEITATAGTQSAKAYVHVIAAPEADDLVSGVAGTTDAANIIEDTKVENATDGNEGTELRWGCGDTEEHYLIFDLASGEIPGYYIESVDLLFEGAYATEFTVTLSNTRPAELDPIVAVYAADTEAAKEDRVFTPEANNTRHIFINDPEGYHRYVTLRTTKALNAGWGIKVKEMKVYGTEVKSNTQTGIEDIIEDANAAVEYFNLNGIRVANPENGLYIRRAGSKVEKVFIR